MHAYETMYKTGQLTGSSYWRSNVYSVGYTVTGICNWTEIAKETSGILVQMCFAVNVAVRQCSCIFYDSPTIQGIDRTIICRWQYRLRIPRWLWVCLYKICCHGRFLMATLVSFFSTYYTVMTNRNNNTFWNLLYSVSH